MTPSLVTVLERDGSPLHVAEPRRLPSRAPRRALRMRDRTCRYPGCGVPAAQTHVHHIEHHADGGAADLTNLLSLCGFHHRRHHDGEHTIDRDGPHIRLVARDGRVLGGMPAPVVAAADLAHLRQVTHDLVPQSPVAGGGGARSTSTWRCR